MNGRFQIALHIMTLLCNADDLLSSEYMAGSINVNPVLVRKELSNLIKHQLIISQQGKKGGYSLAKPAKAINLANIYLAVKPNAVLGQAKNEPNPACPVGKQINIHLNNLDKEIEKAMLINLKNETLAQFCAKFE